MATLKTVDGATLKSVSWEAALLEAAIKLEEAIAAAPNAAQINFVGTNSNDTTNTITITANLPLDFNVAPDGRIVMGASAFVDSLFVSGGDIKSATLPAAFLEIAQTIKNLERQSNIASKVAIAYNSDRQFASINADFDINRVVGSDGSLTIYVVPYVNVVRV